MCDSQGRTLPHYDVNQERELYKYFQPIELGFSIPRERKDNNKKHDDKKKEHQSDKDASKDEDTSQSTSPPFGSVDVSPEAPQQPRPSPDRALTAFAQLATLRLNCRRAFISFFDRSNQYIVAEATRSLSLETLHASQPGDEIVLGVTTIPKKGGLCENTVSVPDSVTSTDKDVSAFIVNDCAEDDRFMTKPYVTQSGFRFYAGVPIVSPAGYKIGSYCVIDDKPRKGVTDDERSFLKDMATTVMIHMDMLRANMDIIKGERLVRGLGSFVEGKASIDDWWMGPDAQDAHTPSTEPANSDTLQRTFGQSHKWARKQYSKHHDDTRESSPAASDNASAHESSMLFDTKAHDDDAEYDPEGEIKPINESPRNNDTAKQDTLSIEVKATFGRATRIMREALAVDGVCCFDAKAGHTFGGLIDQEDVERPNRRRSSLRSNDPEIEQSDPPLDEHQMEDHACEVLGFSTTEYSSIDGHQSDKVTDGMTEKFLRSLLRRFPCGKILNFDEHGDSPNEPDDPSAQTSAEEPKTTSGVESQTLRSGEAAFIRKIFPNVRSLAIIPLWDSRQRFFSGCIAWTRSPYRILTSHSELSYIAAFGDSIMAEVSRIDAKIADKAKSDFISSISHELRSPLHGILGSVECLQDSKLDTFQENLVHTVETCGKTLLDTIDHLLDFAKINNFTRKGGTNQQGKKTLALDVDVDLSVVTEEVLETVFAGHDFMKINSSIEDGQGPVTSSATSFAQRAEQRRKSSQANGRLGPDGKPKEVAVVVDINKAEQSHWIFRTQAGAWRRVLMNLFGNSLKYTREGFVQVKLNASPLPREGKTAKSTVTLTVIDSGKGIAQDYLDKSLFVPFAQEDSMQPGTGLGLAITAAIIRSMGGTIEVKSEKDHGTEIKVTLEMTHAPYSQESLEQSIISNAARRTKGLKIGFVGFDADSFKKRPDNEERSPDNARHMFMSSFHRLCHNWLGMDMKIMVGLDQSDADIFLTTEAGLEQIQDELEKVKYKKSDKDAQVAVKATPLLVLCNSASLANNMLHNKRACTDLAEYISQPCGPRKLAKSLVLCLERLEAHKDPKKSMPEPNQVFGRIEEEYEGVADTARRASISRRHTSDAPGQKNETREVHNDQKENKGQKPSTGASDETVLASRRKSVVSFADDKEDTTKPASAAATPAKTVRNVMLVDDNKINIQLLVTYMKKTPHRFTTASDGQVAVDAYKAECEATAPTHTSPSTEQSSQKDDNHLRRELSPHSRPDDAPTSDSPTIRPSPFDYILMDVNMPRLDGLEATRQIRAYERANGIAPTTVIALTGLASAEAQQEAYVSGVNTFMTKPVKLKDLGELLNKDIDGEGETSQDTPKETNSEVIEALEE